MKIKCTFCGYEWDYNGAMYYATCPRCQKKTKIKEVEQNHKAAQ